MVSKLSTHPGCQDIYDAPATTAVSVSTDDTTWTNVTPTPHAPANPKNEQCPPQANAVATDVITFPATCARYVRLSGTKRTIDDRYWAIGEMTIALALALARLAAVLDRAAVGFGFRGRHGTTRGNIGEGSVHVVDEFAARR